MKILICKGNPNAKSYPYWDELTGHDIKVLEGKLSTQEIIDLVNWSDKWVSVDTFLPHFCAYHKLKPGIVIFAKSDPEIFGYKHNINLLKDRKYLRAEQFKWWKDEPINKEAFVSIDILNGVLQDSINMV
jgi:ADP-heptose:LPS heptosyltransferase